MATKKPKAAKRLVLFVIYPKLLGYLYVGVLVWIFRRKLNRFELAFCSKHFNSAEMDDWDQRENGKKRVSTISFEAIRIAGDEIKEALRLIKKRIKQSDDFDVARFLTDAEAALISAPSSMEEWKALAQIAEQEQMAVNKAKGPWEQMDIDWSEYHAKAKEVLDDPFYWDCLDDIAPHGNDTGAILLEDFRQWNKRNSKNTPLMFLEKVTKKMGMEPFDWLVTDKTEVLKIDKERPIEIRIANETAIALAFAVLKMRASCPRDVVDLANCALERTSIIVKASSLKDEINAEWDVGIKRMGAKLDSSPR